jgi:catechol 2,3-dioxygenase-like lactoylglutathione lyase family enzyme
MTRLHHVALGARDVERVAAFYRELLGLPEIARQHDPLGRLRAIWLDMDGTLLMVEETEEPARRVERIGSGPFLLAFAVTPEERRSFERALERTGFEVESRSEHSSYARDPEGNRFAVSHYPHPLQG